MQVNGGNASYIVGLTGGIGSGKTAVSEIFRELGADIIDADEISRNLLKKGAPLVKDIVDHFGTESLDAQGNLDRPALRQRIFNDPSAKGWLESLLHPAIRKEIQERIHNSTGCYILLVVPLLLESGDYDFVDRILVVDIPESLQVERIMQRDGTEAELVRRIIESQATRQQRLEQADDVLDNSGSLDEARTKVRQLHEQYMQAASAH